MSDPSTIAALISSIVSTFTAYVGYRTAVDSVKAKGEPTPVKSAEASKGEQAAQVVEAGIHTYGQETDKTTLALFQQHPTRFASAVQELLVELAEREPSFLAQLRALAQQTGVQPSVQGTVNVSGHGRTYGITVGVITGSVTGGTISVNKDDDEERPRTKI